MPWSQASACDGKVRHASKRAAQAARQRLRDRHEDSDPEHRLDVYRCPFCRCYHLGHDRRRKRK